MPGNQKQRTPNPTNDLPEEVMADIRAAQARYARQWRARNPERQAAIVRRYWIKKAAQMQQQAQQEEGEQQKDNCPQGVEMTDLAAVKAAVSTYLDAAKRANLMPTLTGLCIVLHVSWQHLNRFIDAGGNDSAIYLDGFRTATNAAMWQVMRYKILDRKKVKAHEGALPD